MIICWRSHLHNQMIWSWGSLNTSEQRAEVSPFTASAPQTASLLFLQLEKKPQAGAVQLNCLNWSWKVKVTIQMQTCINTARIFNHIHAPFLLSTKCHIWEYYHKWIRLHIFSERDNNCKSMLKNYSIHKPFSLSNFRRPTGAKSRTWSAVPRGC